MPLVKVVSLVKVVFGDCSAGISLHLRSTEKPLCNKVHYSMVLDIRQFKETLKLMYLNKKMHRLYRKMTIYGHFSI